MPVQRRNRPCTLTVADSAQSASLATYPFPVPIEQRGDVDLMGAGEVTDMVERGDPIATLGGYGSRCAMLEDLHLAGLGFSC